MAPNILIGARCGGINKDHSPPSSSLCLFFFFTPPLARLLFLSSLHHTASPIDSMFFFKKGGGSQHFGIWGKPSQTDAPFVPAREQMRSLMSPIHTYPLALTSFPFFKRPNSWVVLERRSPGPAASRTSQKRWRKSSRREGGTDVPCLFWCSNRWNVLRESSRALPLPKSTHYVNSIRLFSLSTYIITWE